MGQQHSMRVAAKQKLAKFKALPTGKKVLYALIIVVVIALIIWLAVEVGRGIFKDGFLPANGSTGGNNPAWWLGSQHAGHGGSVDRNQSPNESRAYGSSTESPHDMAGLGGQQPCGHQSVHAADEAGALRSAQGLGDDSLASLMHGGE